MVGTDKARQIKPLVLELLEVDELVQSPDGRRWGFMTTHDVAQWEFAPTCAVCGGQMVEGARVFWGMTIIPEAGETIESLTVWVHTSCTRINL